MRIWIGMTVAVVCGTAIVQLVGTIDQHSSSLTSQANKSTPVVANLVAQQLGKRMPVPPNDNSANERDGGGHVLLGLETVAGDSLVDNGNLHSGSSADSAAVADVDLNVIGGWAGRTSALIAGDDANNCWSLFDLRMDLVTAGTIIHGTASYTTTPAQCSTIETGFDVVFDAQGTLEGGLLEIVMTHQADRDEQLLFRGTAADGTLNGSLFLPDGRLLSAPTVLERQLPVFASDR